MSDEARIPLFPLSTVVMFPGCQTPLHIFETRYRQMTAAALEGDRRIGMVTVRPEQLEEIGGDPALYEVGCCGFITRHERLADGRYNIVLRGTHRFRLEREIPKDGDRLYRVGLVVPLEESLGVDDERNDPLRRRIVEHLGSIVRGAAGEGLPFEDLAQLDHESFVNAVCQALGFPSPEKQGLLEAPSVPDRMERLEGLLAFHRAAMASPGAGADPSGTVH